MTDSQPVKMQEFTGRLDRNISELILISKNLSKYDVADLQTLKHHVEDLELATKAVKSVLSGVISQ